LLKQPDINQAVARTVIINFTISSYAGAVQRIGALPAGRPFSYTLQNHIPKNLP
jgi:hypothetical protein